jgi:hypothetical protein
MAAVPPTSVGAIPGFLSLTASVSADLAGAAHLIGVREALRIAEHMHAVHQVNSWKCRILTLRLGEAHGVRVNNLKALNDGTLRGLLWLHAQGRWKFHEFDGEQVIRANHKEGMQHGSSDRMLLVPAQLMRLQEHFIDVLPTDSATGEVDGATRPVPSMVMAMPDVRRRFDWR